MSGPALPTINGHRQLILLLASPSDSPAINIEPSINAFPPEAESSRDFDIEATTWNTNVNNSTLIHQELRVSNDPLSRKWTLNQTDNSDDAPRNNTWSSFEQTLGNLSEAGRSLPIEYEPPLDPPKLQPTGNAWLAALAAGSVYLATPDPEKRRKRQNTGEREKTQKTGRISDEDSNEAYTIILQPETRPISQGQHDAEVKGMYAGLVMVKAKCIEVDNQQADLKTSGYSSTLFSHQWQALIALHRTLLHEHHDIFLASQHPSASPALRRLALKYGMPARMWRYGIHSFRELMGHRLPDSCDHILAFIYLSYSTIAFLYGNMPAFEDTWMETLGDLGRYRMAIEDGDVRNRDVWTDVAKHWSSNASDRAPTIGRPYHHLGILARTSALAQLSYLSRLLSASAPLFPARHSILTLFGQILSAVDSSEPNQMALDHTFVKAHGILFKNSILRDFETQSWNFIALLVIHIRLLDRKFREQGYHIAIANSMAALGFGSKDNLLMGTMDSLPEQLDNPEELPPNNNPFYSARKFAHEIIDTSLRRVGDPNVLPLIHVSLAFMHLMSRYPPAKHFFSIDFPWESLKKFLNDLLDSHITSLEAIVKDSFPILAEINTRPLPEDFAMRGLLWVEEYFPSGWFSEYIDHDGRAAESASVTSQRKERILWLGVRIAKAHPNIFSYHPASYNPRLDDFIKPHFSVNIATSSDSSLDASESVSSLRKVDTASATGLVLGSDQYSPCLAMENDVQFNGIHATLALPSDGSEESLFRSFGISQGSSDNESGLTRTNYETLESWLSDLVNLGITLLDSDQEEHYYQKISRLTEKVLKSDDTTNLPDMVLLCHHSSDKDHDGENPAANDLDKDDQDQQDFENVANRRLYDAPKDTESLKLFPGPPTPSTGLEDECFTYELIESPLQMLPKFPSWTPLSTLSSPKINKSSESASPVHPTKPFVCAHTDCQKAFARISDMNKHMRYHTRPFSCQVPTCGYTCGRQQDLDRHQHGVHKDIFGEEEFPCPFEDCDKKYSRRDNLKRHLNKWHGEVNDGHDGAGPL